MSRQRHPAPSDGSVPYQRPGGSSLGALSLTSTAGSLCPVPARPGGPAGRRRAAPAMRVPILGTQKWVRPSNSRKPPLTRGNARSPRWLPRRAYPFPFAAWVHHFCWSTRLNEPVYPMYPHPRTFICVCVCAHACAHVYRSVNLGTLGTSDPHLLIYQGKQRTLL